VKSRLAESDTNAFGVNYHSVVNRVLLKVIPTPSGVNYHSVVNRVLLNVMPTPSALIITVL
jgi:hypothetical protein